MEQLTKLEQAQEMFPADPARHMTAMPGACCSYCGEKLPDEAIGNPLWRFKRNVGRGCQVYCNEICMGWFGYRRQEASMVARLRNTNASEEQLADAKAKMMIRLIDTYPGIRYPDPKNEPIFADAAEIEQTITEPSEKPSELPSEPVVVEDEQEPIEAQETAQSEAQEERTVEFKVRQKPIHIKLLSLQGEYAWYDINPTGVSISTKHHGLYTPDELLEFMGEMMKIHEMMGTICDV